jgi:hypothetical protein
MFSSMQLPAGTSTQKLTQPAVMKERMTASARTGFRQTLRMTLTSVIIYTRFDQ